MRSELLGTTYRCLSFSFLITPSLSRSLSLRVVSGDQGGDLSASPREPVPLESETRGQPCDRRPARARQARQPPVFLELVKRDVFIFFPLNPSTLLSDISRTRQTDRSGPGVSPTASVRLPTCRNVLNKHSYSCVVD